MPGCALYIKKETVSQLGTLKKNIIKQEKDLRDISTSTLQTIILTTTPFLLAATSFIIIIVLNTL